MTTKQPAAKPSPNQVIQQLIANQQGLQPTGAEHCQPATCDPADRPRTFQATPNQLHRPTTAFAGCDDH